MNQNWPKQNQNWSKIGQKLDQTEPKMAKTETKLKQNWAKIRIKIGQSHKSTINGPKWLKTDKSNKWSCHEHNKDFFLQTSEQWFEEWAAFQLELLSFRDSHHNSDTQKRWMTNSNSSSPSYREPFNSKIIATLQNI